MSGFSCFGFRLPKGGDNKGRLASQGARTAQQLKPDEASLLNVPAPMRGE